jgi:hypothetical protein
MEKKKGCLVGIVVFLFLVLIIIIAIISCSDDKKEPAPAIGEPAGEETAGEEAAEPAEPADEPEEIDTETLAAAALSLLEANFEGSATVEYDAEESSFNITPTDPAFVAEAIQVMEGSAQALKDWASLVESMKGLSESIAELIPDQYLQVVNPDNPELSLLILLDGYVDYNFADE